MTTCTHRARATRKAHQEIERGRNQKLCIDDIPEEMKALPQFILHNFEKIPVDANGMRLKNWPEKGRAFFEVREELRIELRKPEHERKFRGISFMPDRCGIVCIDIDHARNEHGELKAEVIDLIDSLVVDGAWVEESMSGNVHVWTRASWHADKTKHGSIEVFYGSGQVALTGKTLSGYASGGIPSTLNPLQSLAHFKPPSLGNQIREEGLTFEAFDQQTKLDQHEWTLERVSKEIMPRLPIPYDYDLWFKVACALKHQFGDEAYDIFENYSQNCPEKFHPEEVLRTWNAIKNDPKKTQITLRSLCRFALNDLAPHSQFQAAKSMFPVYPMSIGKPRALNYVIDGFLTDEIFVIAGAPGSGKSSLLCQLALAACHLCPDDYELKPLLRRKVIYITEDARQVEDIVFGLRRWGGLEKTEEEIAEWLTVHEARRAKPALLADLIRWKGEEDTLSQHGVSGQVVKVPPLIVFDTAASIFDLENESANSEVSSAISQVKAACSEHHLPLWIIAHTPKVQRNDMKNLSARGAGAWTGDVHGTAFVYADESDKNNRRFMQLGKTRFEPDFHEIVFDTKNHTVLTEHDLGHLIERTLRVGLARKGSSEDRLLRQQLQEQEKHQELKMALLKAAEKLLAGGVKVSKTSLKEQVTGKSAVLTQMIKELIENGDLVETASRSLVLGCESRVQNYVKNGDELNA